MFRWLGAREPLPKNIYAVAWQMAHDSGNREGGKLSVDVVIDDNTDNHPFRDPETGSIVYTQG